MVNVSDSIFNAKANVTKAANVRAAMTPSEVITAYNQAAQSQALIAIAE